MPEALNAPVNKKFDVEFFETDGKWTVEIDLKWFNQEGFIGVSGCDSPHEAIEALFHDKMFAKEEKVKIKGRDYEDTSGNDRGTGNKNSNQSSVGSNVKV